MTSAQRFLAEPDLTISSFPGASGTTDANRLFTIGFPDGSIVHETDYGFWDLGPPKEAT